MKQVALVAFDMNYSIYMKKSLEEFFSGYASFHCYDIKELESMDRINESVVLFSGYRSFQQVKRLVGKNTTIVQAERTLSTEAIYKLNQLPQKCKALLVSIDYRNCIEAIETIYSFGFSSIEFEPYYPGYNYDESITIAVTPGETGIIPKTVQTVVDLGQRSLNKECIFKLAEAIDAAEALNKEKSKEILGRLLTVNYGVERMLSQNRNLYASIESVLKMIQKGIIITDRGGKILLANDMAKTVLGRGPDRIEGFNLYEVFPEFSDIRWETSENVTSDKLIEVDNKEIVVTLSITSRGTSEEGVVIMVEPFNEIENRQHKIRSKIRSTGHKASYTFDKIMSISPEMDEVKKIAKRMATSDSSVCIYGESGTGKELFAQSIHNYSRRKDYLFVAINCSALPENLLESELYGYEEGAFSGASKGGKIGLFEMAHKGTLFLDEIGEMPLQMQAKLLRAIEEQKILKIGGRNLIDVDVRIICASNRNLRKMVEEGTFREDLYYRLCVLPIKLPPLRRRKGDIPYLVDSLKKAIGADFSFTPEAEKAMQNYKWPGNVRELKNNIEYLANLGEPIITAADLPIFSMYDYSDDYMGNDVENLCECKMKKITDEELMNFILGQIEISMLQGKHIGRMHLAEKAKDEHIDASEQCIRKMLKYLCDNGYIISSKGRKGSTLTEKGRLYMKNCLKE